MATIAENLNIIESVKGEIKDILSLDNHLESYPNAIAEGLTDEAELQTISERTTADGASIKDTCAYVKSIHGNCVKWNQFVVEAKRNYANSGVDTKDTFSPMAQMYQGSTIVESSTFVTSNGVLSIVLPSTKTTGITRLRLKHNGRSQDLAFYDDSVKCLIWQGHTMLFVSRLTSSNVQEVGGLSVKDMMLFDLTAMGWEDITTADEFAQRLGYDNASSLPYFAYDEGSIKTFNATKIVSKDSDGETIGELSTDIPSLFADGLCSAGTAYDEVTKNKAVKRIGKVDLGTLTWAKYSVTQGTLFRADISDIKQLSSSGLIANIYCAKYETTSATTRAEGTISVIENRSSVDIIDSSYTDATAFKNSLNGVYLYYELATPVEQTLTERKSWYKVSANGKEQIVGTNSAPMKAEIGYRYISEVATTALDEETDQ